MRGIGKGSDPEDIPIGSAQSMGMLEDVRFTAVNGVVVRVYSVLDADMRQRCWVSYPDMYR